MDYGASVQVNTDNGNQQLKCPAGLPRKYPSNPIIGNLNFNSLRNKIIDLRHFVSMGQLEILTISETKFDDTFPDAQFNMDGYYNPAQFPRDRSQCSGGLVVFIRNGIPVKRVKAFESSSKANSILQNDCEMCNKLSFARFTLVSQVLHMRTTF